VSRVRAPAVLAVLALAAVAACGQQPGDSGGSTAAGSAARPSLPTATALSDEELAGQLLMPYAYGSAAESVSAAARRANERLAGVGTPGDMVRRFHLGGLILVRGAGADPTASSNPTSNIADPAQLRRLTAGLQRAAGPIPLLVGTDQEHGVVTRVRAGVTLLPSAMAFGAAADPALTERAAAVSGEELASAGVNVDFAPVADVTGGAGNTVIGSRSFGSSPGAVSAQLAAAVRGYESAGVAATLKHFPGHGHTATDSHRALPVLRQDAAELESGDIAPFEAGIAAGASLVMTGHLEAPALDGSEPATFSKPVVTGLLREKLKFGGVVVTDAMNMDAIANRYPAGEAAVRAVLAGSDVVLMPPDLRAAHAGLVAALKSGRLPRERARESVTRILALKLRIAARHQPSLGADGSAEHQAVADRAAAKAVTILRGPCAGPLVHGPVTVTGGSPAQRTDLAGELRRNGVDVRAGSAETVDLTGYGGEAAGLRRAAVTVGLDTPYVLASAPSPVLVAAFSAVPGSLRAVAAVLAGKASAPGRSPVSIAGLPATACP
jgi:beta-N-acetylhexosaminidase